ncbi:MAG: hypothetical protein ACR2OG_13525 [Gemmatimonadaceae bacterium]
MIRTISRPDSLLASLESHGAAAALYLHGTLSSAGVLSALRRCYALPERVRALRVDLRGVRLFDASALDALALSLAAWRDARQGLTWVTCSNGHMAHASARDRADAMWEVEPVCDRRDRFVTTAALGLYWLTRG